MSEQPLSPSPPGPGEHQRDRRVADRRRAARNRSGEQTRATILDAAEVLFARNGYRATSLEEIGREAGLSRGSPGYFFKSKEGLYREMLGRMMARAHTRLAPAYERARATSSPLRETLTLLVAAHLDLLASEPTLVRTIQWEILDADKRAVSSLADDARLLVSLIQELSERAGRRITDAEAAELLISAGALCWFPFASAHVLERMLGRDPRRPDVVEQRVQQVVDFMLAELGRSTPPN